MNTAIRPSILVLTLLMSVGLIFFIRIRDRTQKVKLVSEQAEASLMVQLQQYFAQRSYWVVDAEQNSVTFEGSPSQLFSHFLTLLAASGILLLWFCQCFS